MMIDMVIKIQLVPRVALLLVSTDLTAIISWVILLIVVVAINVANRNRIVYVKQQKPVLDRYNSAICILSS